MFTGIIKEIGKVKNITTNKEGKLFEYESNILIKHMEIDDSVAINGACQTVVKIEGNRFYAQAVHTTLEKTTLDSFKINECVNLELALQLSDRLGGHLVQGHINGVGSIKDIKNFGNNYLVTITYPKSLEKYFILEGSVALDGISLTIAELTESTLTVSVIPHTWDNTSFSNSKIGKKVNIEVDLVAKYVERMVLMGRNNSDSDLSFDWIKSKGF